MKQPSFDSDNQSQYETYFDKARKEELIADKSIARKVLTRQKAEEKGPIYTIHLNGFNLYSRLGLVSSLAGFLFIIGSLIKPMEQIIEKPGQSWSILAANNTKQDLQRTLIASDSDPKADVTIAFSKDREQLTEWDMIPPIRVTDEIFSKLGFRESGARVIYEANVTGYGYLKFEIGRQRHSVKVADSHIKGDVLKTAFYPLYVSGMDGTQGVKFRFNEEDSAKMTSEYFTSILDDLVPVTVPDPTDESEDLAIFWFRAQPELFDLLVSNTEESEQASLSPREEIEKTELRVLGNPFRDNLSVDYELKEATTVSFELVSVGAGRSQELMPMQKQKAGLHQQQFELSSLPKGIYMLVLTTGTERIAKRIIKE